LTPGTEVITAVKRFMTQAAAYRNNYDRKKFYGTCPWIGATTLSIQTLSLRTLSITIKKITTLRIMTFSTMTFDPDCFHGECHLC
jgi:hypothetical protein